MNYNFDEDIQRIEAKAEEARQAKNTFSNMPDPGFTYRFIPEHHRLDIYSLDDLTAARHWLRMAFGRWHDKYEHSFFGGLDLYSIWRGDNGWSIWLCSSVENIPTEIIKDTCQVVVKNKIEYELVCQLK
jgi:hypothetical protein